MDFLKKTNCNFPLLRMFGKVSSLNQLEYWLANVHGFCNINTHILSNIYSSFFHLSDYQELLPLLSEYTLLL